MNRSFSDIVKNANNNARLQEECEVPCSRGNGLEGISCSHQACQVLALRICKTVTAQSIQSAEGLSEAALKLRKVDGDVNLSMYRSVRLPGWAFTSCLELDPGAQQGDVGCTEIDASQGLQ